MSIKPFIEVALECSLQGKKKKRKIIQPHYSTFLFYFNNQYSFLFFIKKTQRNKAKFVSQTMSWVYIYIYTYIYIYIYYNLAEGYLQIIQKRTTIKAVSSAFLFLCGLNTGAKQKPMVLTDRRPALSSVSPACVPVSRGVSLHADGQEVRADAFVSWLRVGSEPTSVPARRQNRPYWTLYL